MASDKRNGEVFVPTLGTRLDEGGRVSSFVCKDPMGLCACVRRLYLELLKWGDREGMKPTLIETLRSIDVQQRNVESGVSRTMESKHLPQPPHGLALAFDLAPYSYLRLKGWWPEGPFWSALGTHGEALGLTWGGRWAPRFYDFDHFQLERCACPPEEPAPAESEQERP